MRECPMTSINIAFYVIIQQGNNIQLYWNWTVVILLEDNIAKFLDFVLDFLFYLFFAMKFKEKKIQERKRETALKQGRFWYCNFRIINILMFTTSFHMTLH